MVFLLLLVSFAYLLAGLSGTIPSYRDSGDLIASIHTLGIAHPPGYATYVILGKVLDLLIPFGHAAYRVNLFSALSTAGAAALIGRLIQKRLAFHALSKEMVVGASCAALAAGIAWVVTPAVTELGRVAEMYATSALWAAIILNLLFTDDHHQAVAAFVWALGLAVHPVLLFLLPLFLSSKSFDWRGFLVGAGLGLSVFLFLPIRSAQDPWLNWGDPSSWRNFWRVVTRADYGGLKLHPEQSVLTWTSDDIFRQLVYFVQTFCSEWTGWGIGLGLLGGLVAVRRRIVPIRWAWSWLAAWALVGPVFVVLSNLPKDAPTTAAILQPYYVLTSLLWTPLIGFGLFALWTLRWRLGLAAVLVTVGACAWRAQPFTHRDDFYAYDYGRNLLRSLPLKAVLFDPDDPTSFTLHALQATEDRRQDVTLLNFFRTRWGYREIARRTPELLPNRAISNAQELQALFWSYSVYQRSFYVELPQKLGVTPYRAQGLAYAVVTTLGGDDTLAERNFSLYVVRGDARTTAHSDFFTKHLIDYYAAAHCNFGLQQASTGHAGIAVEQYKEALRYDPELTAAYNNWGIVEFNAHHYSLAVELYQRAVDIDPKNEGLERNLSMAQSATRGESPNAAKLTL